MNRLVIYIHGKGGNAKETEHYKSLFPENDVIGFDYRSQNPWEAKGEFSDFYDKVTKEYDAMGWCNNRRIAKKAPILFAITITESYSFVTLS